MTEFKIRDLVRIKPGKEECCFVGSRGLKVGKVIWIGDKWFKYTVVSHNEEMAVGTTREGLIRNYEKIPDDKIIIYRQGNKVTAKNVNTKETAVAKCHPDDEFDFSIGARLALDRLCKVPDSVVDRSVFEQVAWERDMAMEELDCSLERKLENSKETNLQHYLAEILAKETMEKISSFINEKR